MPVLPIFAIAFIIAALAIPTKKPAPAPSSPDNKEDAGDLMAKALEKYLKEKKK